MSVIRGYFLSKEADVDLEEIFDYTQSHFNLDQAILYLSDFDDLFNQLVQNPELGKSRSEIKEGLRSIAKNSHIVFYRIDNERIRIVRILHGRRDIPKFFESH